MQFVIICSAVCRLSSLYNNEVGEVASSSSERGHAGYSMLHRPSHNSIAVSIEYQNLHQIIDHGLMAPTTWRRTVSQL